MSKINPIIVPYDSSSKISKTSNSLLAWKKMLPNAEFLERHNAELVPYLLEDKVLKISQEGFVPFMLGGDHSLTYYTCKALTSLYGPINILVFDAHHDSYIHPHLNHYTVLYQIQKLLKANINLVGCRKDFKKNIFIQNNSITNMANPCYVSIDVDFFDPQDVSSVVDPVPSNNSKYCSFEYFCNTLQQLKCKIIGADIVEWGGKDYDSAEYNFVHQVVKKTLEFISYFMD